MMKRFAKLGFRACLVGIIVSTVVVGFVAVRRWLVARQAEATIAELRAAGQPITLTDLARPPIPLERNAATYLRRALRDLESMDQEWAAADIEERRLLKSQGKSDQEVYEMEVENDGSWPSAWRQQAFAATFDAYPAVIPLLEQAAQRDDFDWRFDVALPADRFMERMSEFCQIKRQTCRALQNWGLLQATRDNPDEALRACTTLLRLARLYDQGPTMINHLVDQACRGVAIYDANRILQEKAPSAEARAILREELDRQDSLEPVRHGLITERAYGLTCFRDGVPLAWAMFDGHNINDYLKAMQSLLALVDAPFDDPVPAVIDEWRASRITEFRVRAQVRCLLVLLALLDQPEVAKRPDVKVEDLNLPAQTVTDPFDGGGIKLRKTPDGWLIYSVGQDQEDHGGDISFETMRDIGIGPRESLMPRAAKQ